MDGAGRSGRKEEVTEHRIVRWIRVVALLFIAMAGGQRLHAQAFPFYHYTTRGGDAPTTETQVVYPFYSREETTNTLDIAVHPLFSWYREGPDRRFDVLWPLYSFRYKSETQASRDYRRTFLLPLYYRRTENRFNRENYDQFILPVWFQGKQGRKGKYFVVFPIVWYGSNARLIVPLFPPREQNFFAIFPLVGDYRGYWNRDRIFFLLWPLFVYSNEGKGKNFNEVYSFLWPFIAKYGGPSTRGARFFPLFAYVEKDGEYRRAFWLWPLGHYRTGRISKTDPAQQKVLLFLPFYARFRQPNISLDMIFPFYGKLKVNDRVSRGYFLALVNRDENYRRGTREDRYIWFLIRRKTLLPGFVQENKDAEESTGGGFFPFYTRTSNQKRIRKNVVWPFSIYKFDQYKEYSFERKYFIPFYTDQKRVDRNGKATSTKFLFPFFRQRSGLDGDYRFSSLHLFFYTFASPIDRLYAPLWTFHEKRGNVRTGGRMIRWFGNAWRYDRLEDGTRIHRFNLLFVQTQSRTAPGAAPESSQRLFWGLLGRHREKGKLLSEVLWMRF